MIDYNIKAVVRVRSNEKGNAMNGLKTLLDWLAESIFATDT